MPLTGTKPRHLDTRSFGRLGYKHRWTSYHMDEQSPGRDGGIRPSVQQGAVLVVGEVLWDVFTNSVTLGGAPLNFAAHLQRLGHHPLLISAVGDDELGERASRSIAGLGLDVALLRRSAKWKTGTAAVSLDETGQPSFRIERPAAYDDVALSDSDLRLVGEMRPSWLYHGTLFPSRPEPMAALRSVMQALPTTKRFYDVNLRPEFDSPELFSNLIAEANVVKLNESEMEQIGAMLGLPRDAEGFCRRGAERFGWSAVCVTLGADGCAMLRGAEYVRAPGCAVQVADTVGAGDAFAAAFLHGLMTNLSLPEIANFSNRVGALIASRAGAIPDWGPEEAAII